MFARRQVQTPVEEPDAEVIVPLASKKDPRTSWRIWKAGTFGDSNSQPKSIPPGSTGPVQPPIAPPRARQEADLPSQDQVSISRQSSTDESRDSFEASFNQGYHDSYGPRQPADANQASLSATQPLPAEEAVDRPRPVHPALATVVQQHMARQHGGQKPPPSNVTWYSQQQPQPQPQPELQSQSQQRAQPQPQPQSQPQPRPPQQPQPQPQPQQVQQQPQEQQRIDQQQTSRAQQPQIRQVRQSPPQDSQPKPGPPPASRPVQNAEVPRTYKQGPEAQGAPTMAPIQAAAQTAAQAATEAAIQAARVTQTTRRPVPRQESPKQQQPLAAVNPGPIESSRQQVDLRQSPQKHQAQQQQPSYPPPPSAVQQVAPQPLPPPPPQQQQQQSPPQNGASREPSSQRQSPQQDRVQHQKPIGQFFQPPPSAQAQVGPHSERQFYQPPPSALPQVAQPPEQQFFPPPPPAQVQVTPPSERKFYQPPPSAEEPAAHSQPPIQHPAPLQATQRESPRHDTGYPAPPRHTPQQMSYPAPPQQPRAQQQEQRQQQQLRTTPPSASLGAPTPQPMEAMPAETTRAPTAQPEPHFHHLQQISDIIQHQFSDQGPGMFLGQLARGVLHDIIPTQDSVPPPTSHPLSQRQPQQAPAQAAPQAYNNSFNHGDQKAAIRPNVQYQQGDGTYLPPTPPVRTLSQMEDFPSQRSAGTVADRASPPFQSFHSSQMAQLPTPGPTPGPTSGFPSNSPGPDEKAWEMANANSLGIHAEHQPNGSGPENLHASPDLIAPNDFGRPEERSRSGSVRSSHQGHPPPAWSSPSQPQQIPPSSFPLDPAPHHHSLQDARHFSEPSLPIASQHSAAYQKSLAEHMSGINHARSLDQYSQHGKGSRDPSQPPSLRPQVNHANSAPVPHVTSMGSSDLDKNLGNDSKTNDQRIQTLKAELQREKDAHANTKRMLEDVKEDVPKLRKEKKFWKESHDTVDGQSTEWKRRAMAAEELVKNLQAKVAEGEDDIQRLEADVNNLRGDIAHANDTRDQLVVDRTNLQTQYGQLANTVESLATEVQKRDVEIQRQGAMIQKREEEIQKLRNVVSGIKIAVDSLGL